MEIAYGSFGLFRFLTKINTFWFVKSIFYFLFILLAYEPCSSVSIYQFCGDNRFQLEMQETKNWKSNQGSHETMVLNPNTKR